MQPSPFLAARKAWPRLLVQVPVAVALLSCVSATPSPVRMLAQDLLSHRLVAAAVEC